MDIRGLMYRIYWQVEKAILPGFKSPGDQYEDLLRDQVNSNTRWLDVGAGHQVLPTWRLAQEKDIVELSRLVVGIDRQLEALQKHRTIQIRCQGDLGNLPFADNCFDLVTANMVVEHLQEPDVQFREIFRALKCGGCFLFHTPNGVSYSALVARLIPGMVKRGLIRLLEGRASDDIFETHYKANTRNAIMKLADSSGFQISKLEMLTGSAELAVIPPLAVFELLFIKLLTAERFRLFRTNIIAILRKP
jgi:ubiquinone/menaquinone biosynthesis C-methylase UbiE